MPFFPQAQFLPEAALFQLLSELDQPQQQQKTCGPRRHRPQETFTPRFDVTEVADAYELFGEVAGLESENLSIEFSDAQTLVIKGKTERNVAKSAAAPASHSQEEVNDAASEKSNDSHKATVEDEYDEADTPLATPATTATVAATPETQEKKEQTQVDNTPKPKYWVAERKVGSFARSFSFSQRIEQDGVEANLKNGILHVVVPKSHKTKKVTVSVN